MSRRQESTTGYVTIKYQQPVCDVCRSDIPVGENRDDQWRGAEPIYKLSIIREMNGIQGQSITIDLCSACWHGKLVQLFREFGIDTGAII